MEDQNNAEITVFLPPETSTPMPPMLDYVYERSLGWPGKPDDRPVDDPGYIPLQACA